MFELKKVEDYCVVGDGAHASIKRVSSGIPYLSSKNFKGSGLDLSKVDFISESDYEKHFCKKSKALTKPEAGDVVVGIIGSLGSPYCYRKTDNFGLSSSVAILRPNNELSQKYLYYFMKTGAFQYAVESYKSGSAQGFLSLDLIKNLPLVVPPFVIQQKIAAILTTYDDLIETNNRRIQLLEKMAEEIYKEWFVRLRFPGHEAVKVVRGIPETWNMDLASSYFEVVKGKSYKSNEIDDGYSERNLAFINLKSLHRGGGYRHDGLKYYSGKYSKQQVVSAGDIIMAVTDMTQQREVVGRVAKVPDSLKRAVISLDVVKIQPKLVNTIFLYAYLKHSGFGHHIKNFANGANVLHLKPDLITSQKIVMPNDQLISKYVAIASPLYQESEKLTIANQNLAETRDTLLPRLISGKLSVENLDINFPPSMEDILA